MLTKALCSAASILTATTGSACTAAADAAWIGAQHRCFLFPTWLGQGDVACGWGVCAVLQPGLELGDLRQQRLLLAGPRLRRPHGQQTRFRQRQGCIRYANPISQVSQADGRPPIAELRAQRSGVSCQANIAALQTPERPAAGRQRAGSGPPHAGRTAAPPLARLRCIMRAVGCA